MDIVEAIRTLYIGLAGVEFGFLLVITYYRILEAKATGDRGIYGIVCIAISLLLFILATVLGSVEHFHYLSVPFLIVFGALFILMVGTYLLNTSELGVKQHFFAPPHNGNKQNDTKI